MCKKKKKKTNHKTKSAIKTKLYFTEIIEQIKNAFFLYYRMFYFTEFDLAIDNLTLYMFGAKIFFRVGVSHFQFTILVGIKIIKILDLDFIKSYLGPFSVPDKLKTTWLRTLRSKVMWQNYSQGI